MDLLRWAGWIYARLVALAVAVVSAWMAIINLVELAYDGWILAWILGSGVVGAVGGSVYLLSIDGPSRYRTRLLRTLGWAAMLFAMVLPTSLSLFLLPMVLTLIPTIFFTLGAPDANREESVTSS